MKYKTEQDVLDALLSGSLKRSSAMAIKRRFKSNGEDDSAKMFSSAIAKYDKKDNPLVCGYYNKAIDSLTLLELVDLYKKEPLMFTYYHCVRYSIEIMGMTGKVKEYSGMLIHPEDVVYRG